MDNIEQAQQMIPFITCEISFGQNVSELVFGVVVLDLDFEVHINSIDQPIKCNSESWKHVSLRDSSLQWSCWSQLHCPQTQTKKLFGAKTGRLKWSQSIVFSTLIFPWDFWLLSMMTSRTVLSEVWFMFSKKKRNNQIPRTPEQANHPVSIQRPKRWFQILLNCAKLQFVSYTSNWLEQTCHFQKTHNAPPEVDLESWRSPTKSQSWNSPSLHCFCSITHRTILFVFTSCDE